MHFILGNNDVSKNKASPDDPLNFNDDQNKGSKSTIKEQNNDKNGDNITENEDDIAKNDDTIAENDSVTPNNDENDDDIAKDDNGVTKNDDDITENDDKMAESEGENDDGVTENGNGNNTDNENDDGVTENGNGNDTDNENNIVSEDENSRTSMNDGYILKNGEIDDTDDIDQDMPEDSLEGGMILLTDFLILRPFRSPWITKVEFSAGYTKTHSLPSKISPFRSETITKTRNKVTMLGHVCQFFITKMHNSMFLKVKR